MGELCGGKQRRRAVGTGRGAGSAGNALGRIHGGVDRCLWNQNAVAVGRSSSGSRGVSAGLNNPIQGGPVDHQIPQDGKGATTPRLDRDDISGSNAPHVQLAGCRAPHGPMRHPIDHQTAGAADPLPAIMIESDRDLALLHQALVHHVEHLEKGHVGADLTSGVLDQAARRLRTRLAPNSKCQIHNFPRMLVASRRSPVGPAESVARYQTSVDRRLASGD